MKDCNRSLLQTSPLQLIVIFQEFGKLLKLSLEEMNTCSEAKITMNQKIILFKEETKTLIQVLFLTQKILMKVVLLDKTSKGTKSMAMLKIWEKSLLIKGHK